MSSVPTGGSVRCACCNAAFHRLSSHLSWNARCAAFYDSLPSDMVNGVLDDVHRPDASDFNEECDTAGAGQSRKNSRRETTVDKPIDDHNDEGFDDDFGMMSDGDVSVCNNSEESEDESEDNEIPDGIILDLYEEMQELRLNPFGLDRFSGEEKVHIELLHLLKELKAPLKAFSGILNWAAKANGQGHIFHPDCQPSRRRVVHNLYCRYNMKGLIPKEKLFYLPYSRRTVPMIYFDAREVFASLLSCPLLNRDENYLFDSPEKDPFIGPPKSSIIGDINTGQCYRKTYEALVKNPDVDMILPTIVAMDKTQVDTYGRLQMEPLTISHGLLKHSVRSKHTAMRILGYVCHSSPAHQTKMKGGVPDIVTPPPYLPDGSVIARAPLKPLPGLPWATYLLNEMHLQIEFILEVSGYLDLQRHGFKWNLHYNERVYPVVLHPYIPFIIGDTEGHDRLCGHYTARFEKVKQLCRVCECPTRLSGYSKAKFNHRKPAAINRLIAGANSAVSRVGATANLNALKDMSQNYLRNGFGRARFGSHNDRGIFGACPGEMLHLVSLGWFKYCLEAFASQAGGKNSVAVKRYDALCARIGTQLSRHSDRDLPRMNFPKGFSSGTNLMGHEITGCLLVKLFALHTTSFKNIFPTKKKPPKKVMAKHTKVNHVKPKAKKGEPEGKAKKKKAKSKATKSIPTHPDHNLRFECHVSDWILAVSSLLQWHQWMKQPEMPRHQVVKSKYAVQWLMRNVANICPRQTGMGNNTIKNHLVLHICEDILDHGVPENVNSAYAESAHIPLSKMTARNTQKRAKTFTKQAAERYVENLAISSAVYDMECDHASMARRRSAAAEDSNTSADKWKLGGRRFTISWPLGDARPSFQWFRKYPGDHPLGDSLQGKAMHYLATYCLPHTGDGELRCCTEFISAEGHKYRAHPSIYDGQPWHDHAMVEWPNYKYPHPLPAFIHTFIDLRDLPPITRINIPEVGQEPIKAGVYALVHSFLAIDEENTRMDSNTMIGRYKMWYHDEEATYPILYLIDVRNIVGPTIGIRDVDPTVREQDESFLFLFLRKEEWASAWDTMITSCHRDRHKPTFEKDYEVKVHNERDGDDDEDEDNDEDEDDDEEEDDEEDDDNNNDEGDDESDDDDESEVDIVAIRSHETRKKQRRR